MRILAPEVYQENTSLTQTIDALSDKKTKITDDLVINMVTKYFFAYFYPESARQRVDLENIEQVFSRVHKYFITEEESGTGTDLECSSQDELECYNTLEEGRYGLSMLGDIAPTSAIVKDILQRKINPKKFDGRYQGLDLGTGSGILLLAQYIQARRNGFSSIQNTGIELSEATVQHTSKLAKELGFGQAICGDTTQKKLYSTLDVIDKITFISNENIPPVRIPMNQKTDPFYQNVDALYVHNNDKLSPYTQTFPQALYMILHLGGRKTPFVGQHQNDFAIQSINNIQDAATKTGKVSSNRNILSQISPQSIQLGTDMKLLHEVGDDLVQDGIVAKLPGRKHRRSGKAAAREAESVA